LAIRISWALGRIRSKELVATSLIGQLHALQITVGCDGSVFDWPVIFHE
jgi:hypothetical protein